MRRKLKTGLTRVFYSSKVSVVRAESKTGGNKMSNITVQKIEIRMLTASELRQIADIMDNENLPEGTEHNPEMTIRHKMFTTPAGKITLEVCFVKW